MGTWMVLSYVKVSLLCMPSVWKIVSMSYGIGCLFGSRLGRGTCLRTGKLGFRAFGSILGDRFDLWR